MGNRNRTAGHNYEREILKELEELGFDHLSTTRAESTNLDNNGVDICSTENSERRLFFHPQCKNMAQKPKYEQLFAKFKLKLPLVVFHKFTKKVGTKFMPIGQYVIMEKDLFYKLIKNNDRTTD